MTQFTNKTFSVPCSTWSISQEELAHRWEETFGKKQDPIDASSALLAGTDEHACRGCIKTPEQCMACEHMMPVEEAE